MSAISFSHQFSQRWQNAPVRVKNAIVQELDDIVRLLDNDTDLNSFSFTHSDLNSYLNASYEQNEPTVHTADLATTELQALVSTSDVFNKNSSPNVEGNALQNLSHNLSAHTTARQSNEQHTTGHVGIEVGDKNVLQPQPLPENIEATIHQLETHIEDYLSEQMTTLAEDLKKWLHEELQRRTHS